MALIHRYIIFREKHGNRTFLFTAEEKVYGLTSLIKSSPELPKILSKIVKQRIDDGCWYDDNVQLPNLENPQELANFINKRQDDEYEGFEIGYFETF
jgi:hypothetical protein